MIIVMVCCLFEFVDVCFCCLRFRPMTLCTVRCELRIAIVRFAIVVPRWRSLVAACCL